MKKSDNDIVLANSSLSYHDWQLEILSHQPNAFQLRQDGKLLYSGYLELVNNGEMIETQHFPWRFRIKDNMIEQWCNVRMSEALSIGLTYTFSQGSLVIDYLARNSVPTRLDIRHKIHQVNATYQHTAQSHDVFDRLSEWQHRNREKPSDYLIEQRKRDFKEAFFASQWIVLNKEL
ncbi:hypothetical protein [Vibrio viridaestus]|uniref:Uncharacterized protein n=1 Tax=Vibrio viridaestus TaxID=2487322 RepID=A0A3N9TWZ8_9VIBR|nr:hypothetical protein [Vibrio viridaestus]RQW61442.1 hypothetical protein EES38_19060 [Vibrio viridaestus]